ncbi:protein phosphatase 2C domain-containing protein [Paenibacillus sp. GCM10012307]|uniref:Protein phosphatase 2C domain-containing protein n=1 Tax=Paenibacillus roseus TaxID=2798579 RepID=A0A934J9H6_9BACL|nr:protein phosphatase 2C domain-containing protein [Paenibacillus roseus]MBJ6364324.1 protein phosphatase 2C domain-containing protein [Paenibacillus roseus]
MIIEKLSVQGDGVWNEDALIIREETGLFGVLDGATSFVPFRGPNGETGGFLASRHVQEQLEKVEGREWEQLSLESAVLLANTTLRQTMIHYQVDQTSPQQLWSTGIAVIRITEQRIDYAQAGDCMILGTYESDEVRVLTRDQVDHLDQQTRRRWQEAVSEGSITKEQRMSKEAPYILKNKALMNGKGGYGILNGQPELVDFLEYGSISRNRLTGLILLTDGMFPLSEKYDSPVDFAELAREIQTRGLDQYTKELLSLEQSDANCTRYPRIKTSDDKTAIWIRF